MRPWLQAVAATLGDATRPAMQAARDRGRSWWCDDHAEWRWGTTTYVQAVAAIPQVDLYETAGVTMVPGTRGQNAGGR